MKLELKHLAPYLPYCLTGRINHLEENDIVCELCCEHDLIDLMNQGTFPIEVFKPILKPLSDLKTNQIRKNTTYGNEATLKIGCKYLDIDYNSFVWLVSNHYDVFGLIDKGLAIDINYEEM